jgi:hypothetical protein
MILTGRNPGTLRKTCPTTTFSTKNPVWTGLESNRGSGSSILGLCGVIGGQNGAEERKKNCLIMIIFPPVSIRPIR